MTYFFETQFISFLPAFMTSLVISILIVMTKTVHIHRTAKGHAGLEIQSAHLHPTPRVGGLAVLAGLLVAAFLFHDLQGDLLGYALLAAVPVFLAGLMEDTGFEASPKKRLLAAMISSLIMVLLTGQTINSGVAPGVDYLLDFFVVSALFTIFATAAVCHAFNLVDGMNGLAIGISLIAAVSLAVIALGVGDYPVAAMAGGVAAAVLGVFFLNYPFGKLFLGDAGAYTVGFLVAWTGVLLIARNPEVSRWSVLLTIFWPFIDTTAAVLRRVFKKVPIGEPDKLHFHHVIMRAIEANLRHHTSKKVANPLTTFVILPFVAIPAILGVMTAHSNLLAFVALMVCVAGYYVIKLSVIRHFKKVGRISMSKRGNENGDREQIVYEG
ncbi:MAG: hypothetical protein GYB25_03405 [Rhodobacteraceae bacterium]|nr:hypothetical protein [Paracoccaceae bacterium]